MDRQVPSSPRRTSKSRRHHNFDHIGCPTSTAEVELFWGPHQVAGQPWLLLEGRGKRQGIRWVKQEAKTIVETGSCDTPNKTPSVLYLKFDRVLHIFNFFIYHICWLLSKSRRFWNCFYGAFSFMKFDWI